MAETDDKKNNKAVIGAGVSGAGGGTLIVMLANSFPEGSQAQEILIHAAPTIAVALSAITSMCLAKIFKYLEDKEIEKALSVAKQSFVESLKNPETSSEHKNNLRKSLEKLELIETKSRLDNVKSLIKSRTGYKDNPNKLLK